MKTFGHSSKLEKVSVVTVSLLVTHQDLSPYTQSDQIQQMPHTPRITLNVMMKLALAFALVLLPSAAHAVEKWEENFRRCEVAKRFSQGEVTEPGKFFLTPEGNAVVTLHLDELLELQRSIAFLKKCEKFWQCVEDRDAGKKKHCYYPRELR
jgi:hypothetical protein